MFLLFILYIKTSLMVSFLLNNCKKLFICNFKNYFSLQINKFNKMKSSLISKIFLLYFSFLNFNELMSQVISINIEWVQHHKDYIPNHAHQVFQFKNAYYLDNYVLPYYIVNIDNVSKQNIEAVALHNQKFIPFSVFEEKFILQDSFSITDTISYFILDAVVRQQQGCQICILPVRYNSQIKKYEKLVSAEIHLNNTQKSNTILKNHKTHHRSSESVLANGRFYKLSVKQQGIYRINYYDLINMGINPQNINPQNIRIYGNGGFMLPELNNLPRIDDLYENSIYVYGQEDGKFDVGDYILFFASGPDKWEYNYSTKQFFYEKNLYNEKSYYFLTFDKGIGKRVQTQTYMGIPADTVCTAFLSYAVYEQDQFNLIKSGKQWYGDLFDIYLDRQYSFSFPNLLNDSCIRINVNMIARAPAVTSATVRVESHTSSISFAPTSGYNVDFAKPAHTSFCVHAGQNVSLSITYNKGGWSEAKAWLDKIVINAWRKLVMTGNQMVFSNPELVLSGKYVKYNITSPTVLEIWDITNPLDPIRIQGSYSGNLFSFNASADTLKSFIAFNNTSFSTPTFEKVIENQNLHGLPQVDYIIISHPLFLGDANKLAQFHQIYNGLSTVVVTPEQIYNEFSSGSQDPSAIRDFVKMFYDRATSSYDMPKYLLLFGRASYDYKNRIGPNSNFVPTFQSLESLSPTSSYASDDFYGLLDDGEGYDCAGHLDIGIGRIPATSANEANEIVQKIINYHKKTTHDFSQIGCELLMQVPNFSDWRNWITFISDDEDNNLHFAQAEGLSNFISTYKQFNIDKIHLDAYPQITTPGGERAPQVNEAIVRRISSGSLIINYTGHGGENGWAHERILEISDIQNLKNKYNLPLFITATCEFSRFDDPQRIAAGEMLLSNPNGGAIALYSTTRIAFSAYNESINRSVYKKIFQQNNGQYPTLGEIISFAKVDNASSRFIRNFILLGDPAMRLAYTTLKVVTSRINGVEVSNFNDTISAYDFVTVEGYISDWNDNKIDTFQGFLMITVFDKPLVYYTLASNPINNFPAPFNLQKNVIFKGLVKIVNGEFTFSFYVPRDINYAFAKGKISYYAYNENIDASGFYDQFIIGGTSSNLISDSKGPQIKAYLNDTTFVSGDYTGENPILIVFMEDESGINTTGLGIGHEIIAILDNANEIIILNDYYRAEINTYNKGRIIYPFFNLSEGPHSLYIKAWDVFNNSTEAIIYFYVKKSQTPIIRNAYAYPNPVVDETYFIFEHNQSCSPLKIEIDIFDIFGKHVTKIEDMQETVGYRSYPIRWNVRQNNGERLSPGMYFYTITITSCQNLCDSKSGKILVIQ